MQRAANPFIPRPRKMNPLINLVPSRELNTGEESRIELHSAINLDTTAITPASIMTLVRIRLIRDLIGCSKRGLLVKLRHNSHKLSSSISFASRAAQRDRERNCFQTNV